MAHAYRVLIVQVWSSECSASRHLCLTGLGLKTHDGDYRKRALGLSTHLGLWALVLMIMMSIILTKKSVLEKGDQKRKSPFNKYSDNVITRWWWQKIPSIEICGDALLTRWHNPPLSPSLTVMSLPRMRQGTLKGTWVKRGTRENVFFCGRNKLRQSARWEKGPDKHVLTPFYGGLYLRADPLGLCRLPLDRSRPSFNGSCTDSINLTNWCH